MASKSPTQLFQTLTKRVQRRYAYSGSAAVQSGRKLSTYVKADEQEQRVRSGLNVNEQEQSGRPLLSKDEQEQREPPRWLRTPPRMYAPVTLNRKNRPFTCNNDPAKLDAMYTRLLGNERGSIIPEDIKWLAVTHKSFDQGRRGFNDRLAYLGKRIVILQSVLALFHTPCASGTPSAPEPDAYDRLPFQHDSLEGLSLLTEVDIPKVLSKESLCRLASKYGISDVTRWQPKNPLKLDKSGSAVVYSSSLLAIVGALSLQQGGAVARGFARDKILTPLGIFRMRKPMRRSHSSTEPMDSQPAI